MSQTTPTTRVFVQGIGIDAVTLDQLVDRAMAFAAQRSPHLITYVNTHCLNMAERDPVYRQVLRRADLVYCDGMGVIWAARWLGGSLPARLTGADWIDPFARRCATEQAKLFFLGGAPGIAAQAAERLRKRFQGLRIVGTHKGILTPMEEPGLIAQINQATPDFLLVGMGTPRQELWVDQHQAELQVPVIWTIGALLDFVAGKEPRAPRWMADHGLEWLYRLSVNPRRMWRRYLIGNPQFVARMLREWLGRRKPSESRPTFEKQETQ